MSDGDDVCGHEKNNGEPCTFSARYPDGKCGHHTEHDTGEADTGRESMLEKDESIIDLIAGCLQNGDTVPEACAEAGISEDAYYRWRRKGKDDDGLYSQFRKETARARRIAGKRDREELKRACRDKDDTRTWLKLHMNQYGDTYGDEGTDMRDGTEIILHDSAESYREAVNR